MNQLFVEVLFLFSKLKHVSTALVEVLFCSESECLQVFVFFFNICVTKCITSIMVTVTVNCHIV